MHTPSEGERRTSPSRNGKLTISKIKADPFILNLVETMPFVMDKSKSKKGLQYLKELPCSTEVQWDISDSPFVQNNDYQY